MKKRAIVLTVVFFVTLGLLTPGFAEEKKIRGEITKITLTIKDASDKETTVEVKAVKKKIKVGFPWF